MGIAGNGLRRNLEAGEAHRRATAQNARGGASRRQSHPGTRASPPGALPGLRGAKYFLGGVDSGGRRS